MPNQNRLGKDFACIVILFLPLFGMIQLARIPFIINSRIGAWAKASLDGCIGIVITVLHL